MATRAFPCSCARPSSGRRLHRRRAVAPHHRHRQHRQQLQPLPRQRAAADRGSQARRDAAGGLPMDFPTISVHESFSQPTSMYPQPHVHGHRGNDPRAAHGRRRADRRLRQDGAGPAHGRGLGGRAGDPAGDRLDADRIASRRARRRLHRLPPLLGPLPRRGDRRRGNRRRQQPVGGQRGHLFGDGHGQHHGLPDRGAGHDGGRGASAPAVTADRVRVAEHTGAPWRWPDHA